MRYRHCPKARWTVADAATRAIATLAAHFLDKLHQDVLFPVTGLELDGGSEFMADFEAQCQERGIELYVLPPKSPKLNRGVECANEAWRYEFYAACELPDSLWELRARIDDSRPSTTPSAPSGLERTDLRRVPSVPPE